jgi:hypothetical protein
MRALTVAAAPLVKTLGTLPGRSPPPRGGAAGDGGLSAHAARRDDGREDAHNSRLASIGQ